MVVLDPSSTSAGVVRKQAAPARPAQAPAVPKRRRVFRRPEFLSAKRLRTTPGRFSLFGALAVLLCLAAGVLGVVSVQERSDAAAAVAGESGPLARQTQDLYQALADTDAAAAARLLTAGQPQPELTEVYQRAVAKVAQALHDATESAPGGTASARLKEIQAQLPEYWWDVANAQAETRQGHPLGASYQRAASRIMREQILERAAEVHELSVEQLNADHKRATDAPWTATIVILGAAGALVWAQVFVARRTRRVFNPGLVLATLSVLAACGWLTVAAASSRADFGDARTDGWRPMGTVAEARFSVLQARGDEEMTLVQRGQDNGLYERDFTDMRDTPVTGYLALIDEAAKASKGDPLTAAKLTEARRAADDWLAAHNAAMNSFKGNDFKDSVRRIVNADGEARVAFNRLDGALAAVVDKDQADFRENVRQGRDALAGVSVGLGVLILLAAVGASVGLWQRVKEYYA